MIGRFERLVDHMEWADARALEMVRSTGDVDEEIEYRNSSDVEFATPLGEILAHVALHGSHHPGQIARRVREVGGEPRNVDVIRFVREHPAGDAGR